MDTVFKLKQFANAKLLKNVIELGITIEVKPLHHENAPIPMEVTESGIAIDFNPLHPENP